MTCSAPKSSSASGPSNTTFPLSTPNTGAICGTATTWLRKSLNISFEPPATAWHSTQRARPKNSKAPRFWAGVMAVRHPRAKRSMGALVNVSEAWNSASALAIIGKSMPPGGSGCAPNARAKRLRYAELSLKRATTAARIGSLRNPLASAGGTGCPAPSSNWSNNGPMVPAVPVKPAISTRSVGGRCACAATRSRISGSLGGNFVMPSGAGNLNPRELSKGSPETDSNRPLSICRG